MENKGGRKSIQGQNSEPAKLSISAIKGIVPKPPVYVSIEDM
jgi:hypothetical protein